MPFFVLFVYFVVHLRFPPRANRTGRFTTEGTKVLGMEIRWFLPS